MKIHEYQGKELLRRFDVKVPRGRVARSVAEAEEADQLASAGSRQSANPRGRARQGRRRQARGKATEDVAPGQTDDRNV